MSASINKQNLKKVQKAIKNWSSSAMTTWDIMFYWLLPDGYDYGYTPGDSVTQPNFSDLNIVENASSVQLNYYQAGLDLITQLNTILRKYYARPMTSSGAWASSGPHFYEMSWPPDSKLLKDDIWYKTDAGNIVDNLLQDIKVIQNNLLFNVSDDALSAAGLNNYDGANLSSKLAAISESAGEFLSLLGLSFSTKADIQPPSDEVSALSPWTIASDKNLESQFTNLSPGSTHYIAFMLDETKSDFTSGAGPGGYYLPVRYSPYDESKDSKGNEVKDWNDENFQYLDEDGDFVKPKADVSHLANGVEIPHGLGIVITEIVNSKTGVWVGFIKDVFDDHIVNDGWSFPSKINARTAVLYTKPEYLRIKQNPVFEDYAALDPPISDNIVVSEEAIAKVNKNLPAGMDEIGNKNWLNLLPGRVVLSYYSFLKQNHKQISIEDYHINYGTIVNNPSLRYSEGYFYFIVGQSPRMSEHEAVALPDAAGETLEEKKLTASKDSIGIAKDKAWESLLKHFGKNLGKNPNGGENPLMHRLKNDFFVTAASHVNTNTPNPNNQSVLFAIRASYVDALSETDKPYFDDFDDPDFAGGRSFSVQMLAKEVGKICGDLKDNLAGIKKKMAAEPMPAIIDDLGQSFNMDIILDYLYDSKTSFHSSGPTGAVGSGGGVGGASTSGGFPTLLSKFFKNQVYPRTTKKDYMSDLINEAGSLILSSNNKESDPNHIIEIGLRDNGITGSGARITISYILFSPDPESLKKLDAPVGHHSHHFKLFYHDPYISEDEFNTGNIPRSAFPLRVGIPILRQSLEGPYPSNVLHFLLSYSSILSEYKSLEKKAATPKAWQTYLQRYTVPPIKISDSIPPPPEAENITNFSCEELIKTLDQAGNVSGYEQRLIMEKIYTNPKCKTAYYKRFKKSTPAMDPEMTMKKLEAKAAAAENLDGESSSGGISWQLKHLYYNLLNTIDVEGIIALIIACIQAKLGIPLTAEAICEAIIIQLIMALGTEKIAEALLNAALDDPDNYELLIEAIDNAQGPLDETVLDVKSFLSRAPIAAHMALLYQDWKALYGGDMPEWLTMETISVVQRIEKKQIDVQLVAALRRKRQGSGNWAPWIPSGLAGLYNGDELFGLAYGIPLTIPEKYTYREIATERRRMLDLGYSKKETEALLVYDGYLKPKESQILEFLNMELPYEDKQTIDDKLIEITTGATPPGQYVGPTKDKLSEELAKEWLERIKAIIDIQEICVMLIGPMLEGFEDLLRDPLGFMTGGASDWWDNFVESLKRQFSAAWPTFGFPDNLPTVSHMGDYGEKLLEMILTLVVVILGQILNLIIKDALRRCIEESDVDSGPATEAVLSGQPPLRIPSLDGMMAGSIPKIGGDMPFSVLSDLMDDILNSLSLGQICSLLRGEASDQTLYNIMLQVRDGVAKRKEQIKESYINEGFTEEDAYRRANEATRSNFSSMSDIKNMFLSIAEFTELDICNTLSPSTAMLDDICTAFYDRDGKAANLQNAGLTEEEAHKQIDQDLEALKGDILKYAPILFPNNDEGVGKFLNAIPDICDTPGAFTIPPGVEQTMNIITDNILDTVKGALIQDMVALKHFAVPSRAMMAITNPDDLKTAHDMFKSALSRPYKKKCLAFIGIPDYHPAGKLQDISTYPVAYGVNNIGFGGYKFDTDEYLSDVEIREYHLDHRTSGNIEYWPEDIFEHDYFRPTTFLRLLTNPKFYSEANWSAGTGSGASSKLTLAKSLLTAALKGTEVYEGSDVPILVADALQFAPTDSNPYPPSINSLDVHKFAKLLYTSEPIIKLVRKKLEEEFTQDVKSKYLSEMVFEKDHLFSPKISGASELTPPAGNPPGFIIPPNPWVSLQSTPSVVKKVHSLSSTLKSIHGNPYFWLEMFKNYTGISNPSFLSAWIFFAGDPAVDGYEPFSLKPREEWNNSGIIDTGGFAGGSFFERANRSPGYYSLATKQLRDIFNRMDNEDEDTKDPAEWIINDSDMPLLWAFMDLTLGEAIGLTDERIKALFPNFPGAYAEGVILGQRGLVKDEIYGTVEGVYYVPLYVVFDQSYIDPASPLFADPKDMIAHFSANDDPVNRELFKYLSDTNNFPQLLGYIDDEATDHQAYNEGQQLVLYQNFNPNTLKYDFPFTKLSAASVSGPGGTIINANDTMREIFKAFTSKGLTPENLSKNNAVSGLVNVAVLIESLESSMKNDSLIYQNIPDLNQINLLKQLSSVKDTFRIAKGKLTNAEEYRVPPGILSSDSSITDEAYDFSFSEDLDSDIQNLIKQIYDDDFPIMKMMQNIQNFDWFGSLEKQSHKFAPPPGSHDFNTYIMTDGAGLPYKLDPLNIKAQIFGKLLTYKFFEKYDHGYNGEPYHVDTGYHLNLDTEQWKFGLQTILSTYCYSSLQYAYSNQMFAKLKRSRLQKRSFMKQLWDKMLSNSLSGEDIPPVCRAIFDQFGAETDAGGQTTNTDFFKIGDVKEGIIEFYKKSVCKDVYAKSSPEENAVRVALLEGIVKLIVKIYTLEMCIASIIAWDSFDVGDIFATDFMTKIIVNNIEEDTEIEKISLYAKEIIRKESDVKDEQELADKLKNRSALAYMVAEAGADIAGIIRDIFTNENYNPVSTDLELEILYNSDEGFAEDYKKKILPKLGIDPNSDLTPSQDPMRYSALYQAGITDYVVDARFKQNIYTLNYGSGEEQDLFDATGHWSLPADTCFDEDGDFDPSCSDPDTGDPALTNLHIIVPHCAEAPWPAELAHKYINIYGYNKRDDQVKIKKAKNFFHSLPYNYYDAGSVIYTTRLHPAGADAMPQITEQSGFYEWHSGHTRPLLGGTPFSVDLDHYKTIILEDPDTTGSSGPMDPAISAYKTKVLKNYYIQNTEQKQFIKINELMRTYLGGADAFNKEIFQHSQYGNLFNGMLGNVTIQPYVKVVDYTETEILEIADNYDVNLYQPVSGTWQLDPCDAEDTILKTKLSDYVLDFFAELDPWRNARSDIGETNIFNAYVYDYVPLPVWSHFFSEVFLKLLDSFEAVEYDEQNTVEPPPAPMRIVYDKYGFEPFFKEIKFGLRLSYSTTFPVDENVEMTPGYGLKEFREKSFGRGSTPRFDTQIPAWGLKSSKTLFGQRPYYVDSNDPTLGQERTEYHKRYKICDEIQIPIVEVEREIKMVPGSRPAKFTIEDDPTLIPLDQLGFHWQPPSDHEYESIYDFFDETYWQDKIDNSTIVDDAAAYDASVFQTLEDEAHAAANQSGTEHAIGLQNECDPLWTEYHKKEERAWATQVYLSARMQFFFLMAQASRIEGDPKNYIWGPGGSRCQRAVNVFPKGPGAGWTGPNDITAEALENILAGAVEHSINSIFDGEPTQPKYIKPHWWESNTSGVPGAPAKQNEGDWSGPPRTFVKYNEITLENSHDFGLSHEEYCGTGAGSDAQYVSRMRSKLYRYIRWENKKIHFGELDEGGWDPVWQCGEMPMVKVENDEAGTKYYQHQSYDDTKNPDSEWYVSWYDWPVEVAYQGNRFDELIIDGWFEPFDVDSIEWIEGQSIEAKGYQPGSGETEGYLQHAEGTQPVDTSQHPFLQDLMTRMIKLNEAGASTSQTKASGFDMYWYNVEAGANAWVAWTANVTDWKISQSWTNINIAWEWCIDMMGDFNTTQAEPGTPIQNRTSNIFASMFPKLIKYLPSTEIIQAASIPARNNDHQEAWWVAEHGLGPRNTDGTLYQNIVGKTDEQFMADATNKVVKIAMVSLAQHGVEKLWDLFGIERIEDLEDLLNWLNLGRGPGFGNEAFTEETFGQHLIAQGHGLSSRYGITNWQNCVDPLYEYLAIHLPTCKETPDIEAIIAEYEEDHWEGIYLGLVDAYNSKKGNFPWNPGPLGGAIGPILQGSQGEFFAKLISEGSLVAEQIVELAKKKNKGAMKHLTHNSHQFFYKNLAQRLVRDLKNSPEFRLMYDHLFPMKRYMALSFAYAGDSLSKFIPDPTDILDTTKSTLFQVLIGIENSLDYTLLPDELNDFLSGQMDIDALSTQGKQPSLSKLILWIVIRTSLLILKGFVEVTDPAIIIAKFIIDTVNAIQQAVVAMIETALNIAKASIQAAKDLAYSTLKMVEINLAIAVSTVDVIASTGLSMIMIPDPDNEGQFLQDGDGKNITLDKYITIESNPETPIEDWIIQAETLPDKIYQTLTPAQAKQWDDVSAEITKANKLKTEYIKAKTKLDELQNTLNTTIKDMDDALKDAKKTMKELFSSPFLLPGLWAAMIPSMLPYGGGLMPPPLPGGPPSTVPGMIYLALIFLDGWEDMQHNNSQLTDEDANCDDYL